MENESKIIELGPDLVQITTKLGRTYNSFQRGKDSIESAKQEVEFIL